MDKPLSPREFLKARRPERFSDSVQEEGPVLDRSMLEYHLDTLTPRSQENDFARFARHLAERTICTNLLPQTGPTGGGDSKVDSETYPVADDLSLIWCEGLAREAAAERWAFAFSAKKEWRGKVASDIAKIAATKRGYVKAFFVTNQYVKDKARAEVADKLSKKYSLDVQILDRSWILDRIFAGRLEGLAIEDLGLAPSLRPQTRQGPLDLQRQKELAEAEERIKAAIQDGRLGHQLADDCIEAATLARGLERPRTEVEGLFLRAERVAKDYGIQHQGLRVAYDRAWTAFWWHEDFHCFADLYDAAEALAKGTRNAYDLELLSNLWVCLHMLVRKGRLADASGKLRARTDVLAAELERLGKEEDRPSTALQARSLSLHMRLQIAIFTGGEVDSILRELQDVVRRSEGLVGYPLEQLVEIVTELGRPLGDRPAYDELFETVTQIASRRKGEVVAARMLLQRGVQQLNTERPYDAVRSLGRALRRLYKHESRQDLVRALYFIGHAYKEVGLLWAARGSVLTAASVATNDLWAYGEFTGLQAACYDEMKWLELQLGRLPHVLAWHVTDQTARSQLAKEGCDPKELVERDVLFDAILGLLLLKSDLQHLRDMTFLPDVLDDLGLLLSGDALRFALGHKITLPTGVVAEGGNNDAVRQFFAQWRDQPASEQLPEGPALCAAPTVILDSAVLGCRITVESDNTAPCVELGESVLAALESLLATGVVDGIAAREPRLTVTILKSDSAVEPFTCQILDRAGRPHVEILCKAFDPHRMTGEAQQRVRDKSIELLSSILGKVFLLPDFDAVLRRLFRDDLALERSVNFTSSFVTLGNVLGHSPKTRVSAWADPNAHDYPLLRSSEWDAAERAAARAGGVLLGRSPDTSPKGGVAPGIPDLSRTKHTEMETVSLIRESLWERAGWSATLFLTTEGTAEPPALALVFKEAEPAREIFAQWREEVGPEDSKGALHVAIIRCIDKENPYSYRVVIGTNPHPGMVGDDRKLMFMLLRVNTMTPSSAENLERFLRSYKEAGAYFLMPGVMPDKTSNPEPVWDNCILKRDLVVKHAWQVGKNDIDSAGIRESDDPVMPAGVEAAPVLEVLESMRGRTKQSNRAAAAPAKRATQTMPESSPKQRAERRKADRKRKKKGGKRRKE